MTDRCRISIRTTMSAAASGRLCHCHNLCCCCSCLCDVFWFFQLRFSSVCLPCEIRRNNATGSGGGVWTLSKRNKKNSAIRSTVTICPFSTVPTDGHSHRSAATTATVTATAAEAEAAFSRVVITSGRAHLCVCVWLWKFACVCVCVWLKLLSQSPIAREREREKFNDFLPIVTAKRSRRTTKNCNNCNKTKH